MNMKYITTKEINTKRINVEANHDTPKITCVDAVRNLISSWPIGAEKTCGQIEAQTRSILLRSGYEEFVSGATIMRRFHEQKELANIVCNKHANKSKFVKMERNFEVTAVIYRPSKEQ